MAERTFYCSDCDGDGAINLSTSRDPQDDHVVNCDECGGSGHVEMAAWAGYALGLRPYSESNRRWKGKRMPVREDVLISVAKRRERAAKQKRAYPNTDLAYTEYGTCRMQATRKVSGLIAAEMRAWATRCATQGAELSARCARIRATA